ncbi:MAG: ribosomal protein S18-alanine N-acetyltransferase [Chloroflexota bacterium]
MDYLIRRMRREDIEQAVEIDREAFSEMLSTANYRRELKNGLSYYIVACDNQQVAEKQNDEIDLDEKDFIIGMAGFWLMAGEAHIVNIAVRKAYRRRGIGELLLINLINMTLKKGSDIITLEVRRSNEAAQKLYEKYGFEIKGTRRGYYLDDREDAVIMTAEDISSEAFKAKLDGLKEEHRQRWKSIAHKY